MDRTRTTQVTLMIIAVFVAGVISGRKLYPLRARVEVQSPPASTRSATMNVATLADLLHETSEHHESYEKTHPKDNWWDWYAPYINARQHGATPEAAATAAGVYVETLDKFIPR